MSKWVSGLAGPKQRQTGGITLTPHGMRRWFLTLMKPSLCHKLASQYAPQRCECLSMCL